MVEMSSEEIPACVTAQRFLNAVLATEELGLQSVRGLAANVFSLWMCSPLLGKATRECRCKSEGASESESNYTVMKSLSTY